MAELDDEPLEAATEAVDGGMVLLAGGLVYAD
jgi:hypothetical protein